MVLTGSLGFCGLVMYVYRRACKIPFLTQPGEWLWMSLGIRYLVEGFPILGLLNLSGSDIAVEFVPIAVRATFACLFFFAMRRSRSRPQWRLAFTILTI